MLPRESGTPSSDHQFILTASAASGRSAGTHASAEERAGPLAEVAHVEQRAVDRRLPHVQQRLARRNAVQLVAQGAIAPAPRTRLAP
jgi:hypothetical protein